VYRRLDASSLKSSVLHFFLVLPASELRDHVFVVFGYQKLESIFGKSVQFGYNDNIDGSETGYRKQNYLLGKKLLFDSVSMNDLVLKRTN
jgi:hypothetical protein